MTSRINSNTQMRGRVILKDGDQLADVTFYITDTFLIVNESEIPTFYNLATVDRIERVEVVKQERKQRAVTTNNWCY